MATPANKLAEHRARAADAARRVILRGGVEAANLRAIAEEMGATTGLLTRYFPDKRELLRETLLGASSFLVAQVRLGTEGLNGLAIVRAGVHSSLPLDSDRIAAWSIWAAFAGLLRGDARLGEIHRQFPDQLRQILIQGLRQAQLDGAVAATAYPAFIAEALVSQIIGTAMRSVTDPGAFNTAKIEAVAAGAFATIVGK